ncbi:Putative Lectin C-type domain protein (AFU_orthologue; AFUA_2G12590) [Aspergillus calidoustus]|uniref:Maintenance of telomere capping protein 6 n=1 Tax=Aspergillus calidoustus TaxID=454130 RepID=A0A0U5FMI3_ASPCI|nr:Putative Lectin C-type domain protein (AFU_orthologue; AFUA_2G12590) [Aspergillus calidoustus]
MSLKFNPDDSLLNSSWATVLLSERDVAGQVPINFVTTSAISFRAACFGDNVFERSAAEKCLSNLIAVGYRRFNLDVYWSTELRRWLLCPVSIPQDVRIVTASPDATPTSTAAVSEGTVTAEPDESSDRLLYELGPYQCSDDLDLPDLLDIFQDFFKDTNSDLVIYLRYLSLNLHVAADPTSPNEPASTLTGAELPVGSERASHVLKDKLGSYIYTPSQLFEDRRDLNDSWYGVDDAYKPIVQYFTIERDLEGVQSTPDGWPNPKYIQLAAERRLLVEYGLVDPQLDDYDLSAENDVIFSPGYLTSTVPVSTADDGSLDSGCIYNADETDIASVNASWAISSRIPLPRNLSDAQSLRYISDLVINLTACGITSTLNDTLFGDTADNTPDPYRNLTLSSSWAWAAGQPIDPTASRDSAFSDDLRCAVMDLSDDGHWHTANCSMARRAACRVDDQPFRWTLSRDPLSYADAFKEACPDEGTAFAVPRTGLENTYLYRTLLSQPIDLIDAASEDPLVHEVWIDFNSVDVVTCWVTGGPDATCPYTSDPDQLERRTVLVAAIAGIVICIIAALTLFVKCNANRRNSRRNRRIIQGWEYEGVPS